jgi:hypothetical protein
MQNREKWKKMKKVVFITTRPDDLQPKKGVPEEKKS